MPESQDTDNPTPAPADKPADKTAAEKISEGTRKRKSVEERCARLEDDNDSLRGTVKSLEGALDKLAKDLSARPATTPGKKSLWDEVTDFLDLDIEKL